jgi:hypothetical protein
MNKLIEFNVPGGSVVVESRPPRNEGAFRQLHPIRQGGTSSSKASTR